MSSKTLNELTAFLDLLKPNIWTCKHCAHLPTVATDGGDDDESGGDSKAQRDAFFGVSTVAQEVWQCCRCKLNLTMPPIPWSAVDTAVFVTVNGGFRLPTAQQRITVAQADETRRQSAPMLRSLADKFLRPIAERSWPAPWTQHGFPRLKWRDGPFAKLFGGPQLGAFVMLRAAGFVPAKADAAYLEMPDAASDERVAHVAACIAQLLQRADEIDDFYATDATTHKVVAIMHFDEMYAYVAKYVPLVADRIDSNPGITLQASEVDVLVRLKGCIFALLFLLDVLRGALDESRLLEVSDDVKDVANAVFVLVLTHQASVDRLLASVAAAEWRKKNPKPAAPTAVPPSSLAPGASEFGTTKRARTADTLSEEELMHMAIAESLARDGAGGRGGDDLGSNLTGDNDDLQDSGDLVFSNDGKPKGLTNTRQSCHANSLIQALFALRPLRRDFLLSYRRLKNKPIGAEKSEIAARDCLLELVQLFARMDLSSARAVSARRFMEKLMSSSNLRFGLQHDVTEIKDLVLSTFEELIPALKSTFYGTQLRLAAPANAADAATAPPSAWPPLNDDDLMATAEPSSEAQRAARHLDVSQCVREKTTFSDVIVHLRRDNCSDDLEDALERTFLGEHAALEHSVRLSAAILAPPPLLTLAVQRVIYDLHSRRAEKIDTMMRFRRSLSLQRYTHPADADNDSVVAINRQLARTRERLAQLERAQLALDSGATSVHAALSSLGLFLTQHKAQLASVLPSSVPSSFADDVAQVQQHVAQQTQSLRARAEELRVRIDALMSERDSGETYSLHAVLVHQGAPESGHYYSFVRHNFADDDKWYKCNDATVDAVSWSDVCESSFGGARGKGSAYCLIYASPDYRALSLSIEGEQLLDWYDADVVQSVSMGSRSAMNKSNVY
jgi:hypothetical protein